MRLKPYPVTKQRPQRGELGLRLTCTVDWQILYFDVLPLPLVRLVGGIVATRGGRSVQICCDGNHVWSRTEDVHALDKDIIGNFMGDFVAKNCML